MSKTAKFSTPWLAAAAILAVFLLNTTRSAAQTCSAGSEIEPATLSALQSAASGYFQSARAADKTALQAAAEFDLGDVLTANAELLAGQATVRAIYLLDNAPSPQTNQNRGSEFFCGIYNSPDRVEFAFGALPTGRYAIVIEDISGDKTPASLTWILHQNGTQWRIAGLYVKPAHIGGHDANWYLTQGRAYKAKAQNLNAWFYYLTANELMRPFPAMNTPQLEQLYAEMQAVRPRDLPSKTNPVSLPVSGRVFKLTDLFPVPVGGDLDVVAKYEEPDISDTGKTFQNNMALIKALVARYPEFREAFGGVVARAVAPNGQDYGTMLAMKDVK
jgi:hypothetical protein